MRGKIGSFLVLFVAIGLFGGFAWLTRHPDSPWLVRAQEWQVIGPLASRFRRAYLGPGEDPVQAEATAESPEPIVIVKTPWQPEEARREPGLAVVAQRDTSTPTSAAEAVVSLPAETEGTVEVATVPRSPRPTADHNARLRERRSKMSPPIVATSQIQAWRWFRPELTLRQGPTAGDAEILRITTLSHLPVVGVEGSRLEVVFRNRRGWIDPDEPPPHPTRRAKPNRMLLPKLPADSASIRIARRLMGGRKVDQTLGPYELLTDVEDEALPALLGGAASLVDDAYFARYGRMPWGEPRGTVILFESRDDYQTHSEKSEVPWSAHAGHASSEVLVFFAEGRGHGALAGTLVHEITHLVNRRALGLRLPVWISEGLADDLDNIWLEDVAPAGGAPRVVLAHHSRGLDARVRHLSKLLAENRLPSLVHLMDLPSEVFYDEDVMGFTYSHASLLVHYLLEGEEGRYADGFRQFLYRVAYGYEPSSRLLLKEISVEAEALERGFRNWLAETAQQVDRHYQSLDSWR